MRHIRIAARAGLLAAAVLVALLGGLSGCAEKGACPYDQAVLNQNPTYEALPIAAYSGTAEGTVASVSPDLCSLSLREPAGQVVSLQLTPQTLVVMPEGTHASREALTPGMRVRASYRRYADRAVADEVRVLPPEAPKED